jgi:hypothetical protein
MSQQRHKIFQLFLSVLENEDQVVSSVELVRRVEAQKAEWLVKPEFAQLLRHEGLCVWARRFCQRYAPDPNASFDDEEEQEFATDEEREAAAELKRIEIIEATTGYINDQYLLGFIHLLPWEKIAAKKFAYKRAWLPNEKGHKEVCRMSPQERVDAGNAGIKTGQDTVARYKVLKKWGVRGGGEDKLATE